MYPNPSSGNLNIVLYAEESTVLTVEAFDIFQNTVHKVTEEVVPGINTLLMDIGNLPTGIYIIKLATGRDVVFLEKVILKNN